METSSLRNLDDLVTRLATELMSVSASTSQLAHQRAIRTLAEFFGVDTSFVRRNDHEAGASVLVAEWPIRENIPDPDPLGVVPFEGSDPVFAAIRDLREPFVARPSDSNDDYQERVREGAGIPQVALAMVPILHEDTTTGVLGFISFGDREWSSEELNALQAVASLLAQLQGRVDAEERLQYNAHHDELTGLSNRRALIMALESRLDHSSTLTVPLLFIDVDGLKSINDYLGHAAGDHLLYSIANRLRQVVRPEDFVARLGGDEFVVLLGPSTPFEEIGEVASRLLDAIAQPLAVAGQGISRTACVGIALGTPGEVGAEKLMRDADIALLAAKESGGNSIRFCTEEMRAGIGQRADIELHLRTATSNGEMRLVYLPEYDLRSGKILSVEALLRWQHPTRGLLVPDDFIAVAEKSDLIIELGTFALREASAQLADWKSEFPHQQLLLRVNVAPHHLIGQDLASLVSEILADNSLEGNELCLEITERGVMSDLEQVISTLRQISELGVTFAMDDFGMGSSSLARLKSLPVDTLKIDQSFVRGLGKNQEDNAIVESIIRLAETFRLEVVAEGVETAVAVEELLRLGCYRAQGYLLQRPITAFAFGEVLRDPSSQTPRWLHEGVRQPDQAPA